MAHFAPSPMIRVETATGWQLITHPDHARLAGLFAEAWGNDRFARPEPFGSVLYAVHHHDDGWLARDAAPSLTSQGKPEAFTRALVGTYAAFEEIDLPSYLAVRGAATRAVADVDPVAGVLVSMHTVNLLTEQADLASIRAEHRAVHATFVAEQRAWQAATISRLGLEPAGLERGFEFLQACDNLSLIACADYRETRDLRHLHPDRSGRRHALRCTSPQPFTYTLEPWPFERTHLTFDLPYREIDRVACAHPDLFRRAFAAAPQQWRTLTLRSG